MSYMFYGYTNLEILNLSNFINNNVTDIQKIFY